MLKIFVDMDDTINYMFEHFYEIGCFFGYEMKCLKPIDRDTWDLYNYVNSGSTVSEKKKIVDRIFTSFNFWYDIPPRKDAMEVWQWRKTRFDIYIVTSPWMHDYVKCVEQKYLWIKKYFPIDFTHFIPISDKSLLDGDIIIDDSPKVLDNFKGIKITINKGYNTGCEVDYRASNWYDIKTFIENIF